MVTNGVIFSMFKHTDPSTVPGRSILKDGGNWSFRKLKITNESNDLGNEDFTRIKPEIK